MDKREFILGLLGTAAVAITPTIVTKVIEAAPADNFELWLVSWQEDTSKIIADYMTDLLFYGRAAMEYIDEYPYIRRVDLFDELTPTAFKGLL